MSFLVSLGIADVQAIPLGAHPILMPHRVMGRTMPGSAGGVGNPFPIAGSDATRLPPHQPVGNPKHHACGQRHQVPKPGLVGQHEGQAERDETRNGLDGAPHAYLDSSITR